MRFIAIPMSKPSRNFSAETDQVFGSYFSREFYQKWENGKSAEYQLKNPIMLYYSTHAQKLHIITLLATCLAGNNAACYCPEEIMFRLSR